MKHELIWNILFQSQVVAHTMFLPVSYLHAGNPDGEVYLHLPPGMIIAVMSWWAAWLGYTISIYSSAGNHSAIRVALAGWTTQGKVLVTLLAKKVVTPPLKTIKPMWIELLCFHLAEIGMIWTHDCSPTTSDTTLGRHSMQGQVGSSSSETTV